MLSQLLLLNRSYRRFDERIPVPSELITSWVGHLRLVASARNAQPYKYVIVVSEELCHALTSLVGWAGYLTEWSGPAQGERPRAFVAQVLDEAIATSAGIDAGIQLQTLTLLATEAGFGGCIVQAFAEARIRELLGLGDGLRVVALVALGKPSERIEIEPCMGHEIRYWRDDAGVHHVPKRSTEELLLGVR